MTDQCACRSATRLCATLLFAATAAGCSDPAAPTASSADIERFVPSPEQSETALRAVFEAWRQGTPPGLVPDTTPAVHVTDTFRKPDETLVDYRILGEVPSDKKRCYAVELRYAPERAERTRFLVVGIDPLWVFRLEDAENLAHWEHNMETPESGEATAEAGETTPDLPPAPPQAESQP
jgi:hypothetical protein